MSDNQLTIHDRLEDILDSINLIQEWSDGRTSVMILCRHQQGLWHSTRVL